MSCTLSIAALSSYSHKFYRESVSSLPSIRSFKSCVSESFLLTHRSSTVCSDCQHSRNCFNSTCCASYRADFNFSFLSAVNLFAFLRLRFVLQTTMVMAHNVRVDSVSRSINDETFLATFFTTFSFISVFFSSVFC